MTRAARAIPAGLLLCALAAAGCGGGGGGGGGAAGTRSLRTTGGEGVQGDGGDGGAIIVNGLPGEAVTVERSGSVDASFSVPGDRPYLGLNPLVVSKDGALTVDAGGHLRGTAVPTATATGLLVARGVTLTLTFTAVPEESERQLLSFAESAILDGALRVGAGGIQLVARAVLVSAQGAVEVVGASDDPAVGATSRGVHLDCQTAVIVRGRIDARGGDGPEGGRGGAIRLGVFDGNVWCAGLLDARGGEGSQEEGGDGGDISIEDGSRGGVFFSGRADARGGAGATAGGDGGDIELGASLGDAVLSGVLDASGGRGGGAVDDEDDRGPFLRSGGRGGVAAVLAGVGETRVAGTLLARGGDGVLEPAGARAGPGGQAGVVYEGAGSDDVEFTGSIRVSADVDVRGGRGAEGGDGGLIAFGSFDIDFERPDVEPERAPRELALLGYLTVDASGGASTGGRGGDAAIVAADDLPGTLVLDEGMGVLFSSTGRTGSVAPLRLDVDVTGRGGSSAERDGAGGRAGRGAIVEVRRCDQERLPDGGIAGVVARGRFDVRGGDGVRGGRGGQVAVGDSTVSADGEIGNLSLLRAVDARIDADASGGRGRAGVGGPGAGGAGGQVAVLAFPGGAVTSTSTIRAAGGGCDGGRGGDGGFAMVAGGIVASRGDIDCSAGGGRVGGAGGRGFLGALLFPLRLEGSIDSDEDMAAGVDDQSRAGALSGIMIEGSTAASEVRGRLSVAGGRGTAIDGATGAIGIDRVEVDAATGEEVLP